MEYKLYKYISFLPYLSYLPYDDVMQELRIIVFLHSEKSFDELRRLAVNAIYRLFTKMGYSRKKGKDNFEPFYIEKETLSKEEEKVIENIEFLYLEKGLTAREIAQIYNVNYNNYFQKLLHKLFPKNMGLGGKRKGAGRKKLIINH